MRHYKTNIEGYSLEVEEYNSFNELLKMCDDRSPNGWASSHTSGGRFGTDDTWSGGSYDTARDLLLYGWSEKIEEIKSKYTKYTKDAETKTARSYSSPIGFAPIVPNAIRGVPNSMVNMRMETKKSKVIELAIDLGAHCGISANQVINRMIEVMAKVASLENSGFRVKIYFLKTFNDIHSDLSYCCKMLVKNEYQPMDLKRIAFPLGHPAMFRRIMFDWYERLPGAQEISGYGKPLGVVQEDYERQYKKIVKGLTNDNQYVITFTTDLDELFSKLK